MIDLFKKIQIIRIHHTFFLYLFFSCLYFNLFYLGNAIVAADNEPVFSLVLKDESFNVCLERISELSGYNIFVAGKSVDCTISIDLKDVTLEKSLSRILKGINHVTKWDDAHRSVTLYLYGSPDNDYKTEKVIGLSPLLNIKSGIKKAEPFPDRSTFQISDRYQSESPAQNGMDYPRGRTVTLDVSGVKTSFVQETPTGSWGP